MKKIILLFSCFLFALFANAQNLACTGSGPNSTIQILGDDINFCNDGVHLYLNYSGTSGIGYPNTDTYAVVQNATFNPSPWTGGNIPTTITFSGKVNLSTVDDYWSESFALPFKFCFFGQQYNNFIVGNNGQISFDISQATLINTWASTTFGPMPANNITLNNTICSPYHDIYPPASTSSVISWDVYGTAPCRKMVISWYDNPMFSCTSLIASQQIVLYESTNEIEINILNKPLCSSWNGGLAYEGIQNANGTKAYTVPGRNGTQWTASNDTWSFVPAGAVLSSTNPTIYWMDSATNLCLDTGATFNYWPTQEMAVYVIIGDTTTGQGCGNAISPYKHLYVNTVIPNFTLSSVAFCNGGITTFTNQSLYATSYLWDFGDGNTDILTNPVHTYTSLGPFTATLTAMAPGCTTSISHPVILNPTPVISAFTVTPDSLCSGSQVTTNNTSSGNTITSLWDMGDGTTYTSLNVTHTYNTSITGWQTITLTITDMFGCTDVSTKIVWVDGAPSAKINSNKTVACVGDIINFQSVLSTNTIKNDWDFGDGTLDSRPSLDHFYTKPGVYNVVLNANYAICPNLQDTKEITIHPFPGLDLGGPEVICPGKDKITLTDIYNDNIAVDYLWSTGETGKSIVVTHPGDYTLTASVAGVCSTSVVKQILGDIDCIYQPNAFTPNGDGNNDYFKPVFFDEGDITYFSMLIYNRWGQEIYNSQSIKDKGWNGTFNGKKCDIDTYIYILTMELKDGTKKTYKRDVLLMR